MFSRPNGYPFIQKNIIIRMNRLFEYTNITKKATPHIFRHTHISMMTEARIDLATIMEKVGHEDIKTKTTMKIYTHVTNKMKKDASTYNSHLNDRLVNFNPNLSDIHTLKENSNIQIETWGYKSMKFSDFETDEKKAINISQRLLYLIAEYLQTIRN